MKRVLILLLTGLALSSGLADAARRSGGGFGGSASRSSASRSSSRTPSYTPPRYTPPRYIPPRNTTSRTPATTQRTTNLPSTTSVRSSPLNTAAAAKVTPTQLSDWNKTSLRAGVPRSAITYSAVPSSQYRYQLQPGRYFPYPQNYYRQHGMGYDILKYALIFTAVNSLANAGQGDLRDVGTNSPALVRQNNGPNIWTYVGVGFLAAAAGWFFTGRSSKRR